MSSFTDELIHLKNTGSWSGGGTPSKANPAYWEGGTIPWVSPKDMKTFEIVDSQDKITPKAIADSPVRLVPAGSILMVVRSGILAHTFPVAIAKTDVTLNQDMKAIIPREDIVPKFLAYQLISQSNTILTNCTKTGTTVSSVETKLLQSLPVWIPEEAKQEAIVADLDKQLSCLDETTSTLQVIQAKLKQARASILKAAVEGRLVETEARLAKQSGSYYEDAEELFEGLTLEAATQLAEGHKRKGMPASIKPCIDESLPEQPEGWAWARMQDIAQLIRNGYSGKPTENGSVPILRISSVRAMSVDPSDTRRLEGEIQDYEKSIASKGCLLITRYNGNPDLVGVMGLLRSPNLVVHPDKLIRVVIDLACIDNEWVEIAFNTGVTRNLLRQRVRTTAGQAGISGQDVKQMPIPIPPIREQQRIVKEVQRRFSVLDQVESTVNASLKRCGQLKQAVLKRAFGG